MRKAKIVCTIGPASDNKKTISLLIKNGMDVARLNFSHGDHATHRRAISLIREASLRHNRVVSILQDLQGIKIRVGEVEDGGIALNYGDDVFLYPGDAPSNKKALFISYPDLLSDVHDGERVLLDDGLIQMKIIGRNRKALRAKIIEGGILKSKKGVNFPSSKLTVTSFTDKDRQDLEFGLNAGVDYAAISFVRTADDIDRIRRWARKEKQQIPPLIAKIEMPEALDNISDILETVEGIMIARGDLGVEMPPQEVPMIQKRLINLAAKKGKLVITATQMLESMTEHKRPTRAEASDVANAVLDGTDALMLSAETASGKYPVEAVKMMDVIIRSTEQHAEETGLTESFYEIGNRFTEAVADGACKAARDIGAKAIVVLTHSGSTAQLISKLRPTIPIEALTPDKKVLRRMPLFWGVRPKSISAHGEEILSSAFIANIERTLIHDGIVRRGDSIVFAASSPFLGKPNIIRLHRL
jgi:pyruvate kinase